ncbi:hypothetical protein MKW92_031890 [Papaver armeniacum]|nr:hypothetical protein MKW92_031890 [Papaver armeniacum]
MEMRTCRDSKNKMGVSEYEPLVIHHVLQLLVYAVDVLKDVPAYSEHAVQTKVNFNFSQPPPREVLLELARNRNEMPLPNSIPGHKISLSPDEDTLISPNYQHVIPRRPLAQADEEMEEDEDVVNPNQHPNLSLSQEQKTGQQKTTP